MTDSGDTVTQRTQCFLATQNAPKNSNAIYVNVVQAATINSSQADVQTGETSPFMRGATAYKTDAELAAEQAEMVGLQAHTSCTLFPSVHEATRCGNNAEPQTAANQTDAELAAALDEKDAMSKAIPASSQTVNEPRVKEPLVEDVVLLKFLFEDEPDVDLVTQVRLCR